MKCGWALMNMVAGYTAGWTAAYFLGGGVLFRGLCGFAGAMAWQGIAEVIVLRLRRRKGSEAPK